MKSFLEIRFGREYKMYTLWHVTIGDKGSYFEAFRQNLSTAYEQAIQKAGELNPRNLEIIINAPEDLNAIVRGDDVIRFGKYKDRRISEINDDKYLNWMYQYAPVPSKEDPKLKDYLLFKSNPKDAALLAHIEKYLVEKGFLVEYNDRFISKEYAAKIEAMREENAKSEFIGSIGEKVSLNVVLERESSYNGTFGTTYIYQFRDENGNVIVYKGQLLMAVNIYTDSISGRTFSSADSKLWKTLISIGVEKGRYHTFNGSTSNTPQSVRDMIRSTDFGTSDANYIDSKTGEFFNLECNDRENFLQKGDHVTIKGTVKEHSEYNGTKQTILQRVKIS